MIICANHTSIKNKVIKKEWKILLLHFFDKKHLYNSNN